MVFGAHVSWPAVLLAGLAHMFVGMIWFHPKIFGNEWAESLDLRREDMEHSPKILGIEFLLGLLLAFVLALFIDWTTSLTSWEGASVGFWAALGFILTTLFSQVIWSKKPLKTFLIEAGSALTSLIVMGAIIGTLTD
jgi:hypothetical protein